MLWNLSLKLVFKHFTFNNYRHIIVKIVTQIKSTKFAWMRYNGENAKGFTAFKNEILVTQTTLDINILFDRHKAESV